MALIDGDGLARVWAKIKALVDASRYVHPTSAGYKHIPAGGSDGQVLKYGGSSGTAVWGEDQDTTYGPATASEPGLMSAGDKAKLDGIAAGANAYTHPAYTPQTSGLYKITVDAQGHVSEVVAVSKADITDLGIPGQDTNTTYDPATASTPGLMSAADKAKLDGIDEEANHYVHPVHTPRTSGLYKITVDGQGHVVEVAAVAKEDITALGVPEQDTDTTYTLSKSGSTITLTGSDGSKTQVTDSNTTYGAATASAAGLMSAADKSKLDGIEAGANDYTHPGYTARTSGLYKITVDAQGHVSAVTAVTKADITDLGIPGQDTNTWVALKGATTSAAGTAGYAPAPAKGAANRYLRSDGTWQVPPNTTYSAATQSAPGLMSAADKAKLDGIEAGANDYTHPTYTPRTSGLYKITVDSQGHVSSVTAVAKADITALGIPGQDTNTWIAFKGATTSAAGTAGYAPAPAAGAANRYLRSDGTWAVPPDTNTTYSAMQGATSSAAGKTGLVPAPAAGAATRYLRSDGTWQVPPNTTYSAMKGATASAAGAAGLVPAPAAGKQTSFLRGDGTWQVPPNTTYGLATTSANGLLRQLDGSTAHFMRGDGTWATPPNTTYSAFKGATTSAAGGSGLVPAPAKGAANRYLRSDGTWQVPPNTTYTLSSFGITATAAEINKLDGLTPTTSELNFVDGVTSNIQTQLNGKAATGHAHSAATTSSAGFMSAADKTKLNGIAAGANKYVHPTSAGNKHIPSGGAAKQLLVYGSSSGTAKWAAMNTISDDLIDAMCKWVDGGEIVEDIDEGSTNTPKVLDNYGLASVWRKLDAKISELQNLIDQLNGKMDAAIIYKTVSLSGITVAGGTYQYKWVSFASVSVSGYTVIGFYVTTSHPRLVSHFNDSGFGDGGITVVFNNLGSASVTTGANCKLTFVLCKTALTEGF